MKQVLTNAAEVKSLIDILLNQVLDKENYDLKVHGEIHFDECEPDEEGYVMGKFSFFPWGADAFQTMQHMLEQTVQDNYISIELFIENLQTPVEATKPHLREITEDNVRAFFNESFSGLDEVRTAGSMYVGDNGAFIVDYLDVSDGEKAGLVVLWESAFGKNSFTTIQYNGGMQLHLC